MPRLFSSTAIGNLVTNTNFIFDSGQVSTDGNSTGMWRALTPADMLSTIDSVNISGINVNTDQLEAITTSGVRAVTSTFYVVTGSQMTIPAGTRSWAIGVVSGAAYINGAGPFESMVTFSSASYVAAAITVGGTGTVASPTKIVVQYES
jgi:hypothetical protein